MKIFTIILMSLSALFANSGGPNAGHANNAPNFNNCTSCHSGTANTGETIFGTTATGAGSGGGKYAITGAGA